MRGLRASGAIGFIAPPGGRRGHARRRFATPLIVVAIVGILSFLVGVSSIAASSKSLAASADDWPAYLFGPSRTGFNSAETAITRSTAANLVSQWTASSGGTVISGEPVTSNGLIYWGAWDGILRATRPSDGSLAWSQDLGQTPTPSGCTGRTHGILGTATVATETINGSPTSVVYAVGNNTMYALNATSGAQIWKVQYGQSPTETWDSPLVYNGAVYIGTASWGDCPVVQGQVFEFDAATGNLLHTFDIVPKGCVGGGLWGSITVDPTSNTLYFATGNGGNCSTSEPLAVAVVQLNASTLGLMGSWQVPSTQQGPDGDFGSTPTPFTATINGTAHSLVGVANKNGIYYALDEANISAGPVWQDQIAIGGDAPETGAGSISPSSFDGTTLYVAGGNTTIGGVSCKGGLRAVNPASGNYIWEDCLTDGHVISPVSSAPGLVVIAEGPALEVINSSTGAVLFKATDSSAGQYFGGPAIANGSIYIGTQSGTLHAYGSGPPPPPPGTTVAQDTFHRADQSLWGTATDGQVWGAEANTASLFSINNNAGQVTGGSGPHDAVLGPTATDTEVLFTGSASTFSGANIGAVIRWADTNNWYKGYIDGSNLVIQKKVGGTYGTIGTTPFAATAGTSYSLRFGVIGTTLHAKVWASNAAEPANWMLTGSDSSLASGNCGLRMQLATGVKATFTSFLCTVPSAPPASNVRPKGATPMRASLLPAYKPCTSPNSTHGAPLSYGSCSPPAQASSFLTVGTPDSNGAGANSIGSVLYRVQVNTPPTSNDVLIDISTTDVRCRPAENACGSANALAGPDYTGQLQATESVRITDTLNGPGANEPATGEDISFPVGLPCAATADTSIGSTCAISTSANAVVPGSIQADGSRAIWQLGQVQVFDGGVNGAAGASDATLFEDQGVFVP
jgi:hypothetical protein